MPWRCSGLAGVASGDVVSAVAVLMVAVRSGKAASVRRGASGTHKRSVAFRQPGSRRARETARRRREILRYRNLYHARMKTTLNLNDQLLADAKALAAQQRTTLTRLVEEGLQLRLRANAGSAKRARVRLPVFKGRGGLVKGVDPLSNKALLQALDDDA